MKKKTRKRLEKWFIPLLFVGTFFLGTMAVYLAMILQGHLGMVKDMRSLLQTQQAQIEQAQRPAPRAPTQ